MDTEDFLALAALAADPGDDGAFVVEVGHRATGPAAGWRLLRSSASNLIIGMSLDGERIRIGDTEERGCDIAVTRAELAALAAACGDWHGRRTTLWSFVTQRGAFRAPYNFFERGGGQGERTDVPGPWRGAEEEVRLSVAQVIAPGAELVADVIRMGEDVAPDGAPVAVVYALGRMRLTGRRGRVEIDCAGRRLLLGPDDAGLVGELLAIACAQTGGLAPQAHA